MINNKAIAAERFIYETTARGSKASDTSVTGILYCGDADCIAAAVIATKALGRLGYRQIAAVPLGRGLDPTSKETIEKLVRLDLSGLVVVSEPEKLEKLGEVLPGVPVLAAGKQENLPAGIAAYDALKGIVEIGDLEWVAAIGAISETGPGAGFSAVRSALERYGRRDMVSAVVLLNAGYRHHDYKVELAFDVLFGASNPLDITGFRVDGAKELELLRVEVQDEL